MIQYTWSPATGEDIPHIVALAQAHFQTEIDSVYTPEPLVYTRNITYAVVNQFYKPLTELLSVCKDDTGQLLAYTWAVSNEAAAWSDDRTVVVKMAHVDMDLPVRVRLKLISEMMNLWETFAKFSNTPVVCSMTMRKDQDGFLKLHQKHGYDVRGSFAYKRITL